MPFHFANPGFLYLLWLAPALAAWWAVLVRRRAHALDAFVSPAMQRHLSPPHGVARLHAQIALFAAACLFMLLAVAQPRWGEREETVLQTGRDLMICLDVSRSMLATDVHPNRLRRAKADILDLIRAMQGDRAGLIAFRNKGAVVCPMTTDYAFLKQALEGIDIDSAPPGETDIGHALRTALDAFDAQESSTKAIILISDGEDLTGNAAVIAREAGEKRVPVFTVGLGDRQGARIPDAESAGGFQQFENEAVVTRLDHHTLHQIATASGGAYWPVELASTAHTTLGTLYQEHVRKIQARELAETRQQRAIERYQWFLFPGICFALAAMLLSGGRLAVTSRPPTPTTAPAAGPAAGPRRRTPSRRTPPAQVGILLALGALAFAAAEPARAATNAPSSAAATNTATNATAAAAVGKSDTPAGRAGARAAQRLHRQGDYAAAAEAYLGATRGTDPRTAAVFTYNAALARYAAGDYRGAADLLRGLVLQSNEPRDGAAAALGAALFHAATAAPEAEGAPDTAARAQLMRQAADAFRQALRQDAPDGQPAETAARLNLAAAMRDLPRLDEEAKIERLMKAHGAKQPPDLADELLRRQRALLDAADHVATNTTPDRVYALEALAADQRAAADLWIPLRAKLTEALAQGPAATNAQLQAALNQVAERSRQDMLDAAGRFRDLDLSGRAVGTRAAQGLYQLWKSVVPHELLLAEDLRRQTNALAVARAADTAGGAALQQAGDDQKEARELTPMFRDRFEQSVPPEGIPAPPPTGTNTPPDAPQAPLLSAENRAKILELANGVADAQSRACGAFEDRRYRDAVADQETAARLMEEIRDLLPKPPPQSQQSPENQQPEEQPGQEPQPRESDPNDEKPEEQQPAEQPEEQLDEDVEQVLDKAIEREKEHEAEKRRRNRMIRFQPSARDW